MAWRNGGEAQHGERGPKRLKRAGMKVGGFWDVSLQCPMGCPILRSP